MNLRQLQEKVSRLQYHVVKETNDINNVINHLTGESVPMKKVKEVILKKNKLKGKQLKPRQKNKETMEEAAKSSIRRIGGSATTSEIATDMLKTGFKTNSTKFNGVVGQMLSNKKESFKRNADNGNWIIIS